MSTNKLLLAGVLTGTLLTSFSAQAETLNEVLGRTLAEHPEVQASLNKVKAQDKAVKAAKSEYWPTLDVAGGAGKVNRQQDGSAVDDKTLTGYELSASFKQSLFSGFSTVHGVKSARQKNKAETWRLQATLEDVGLKVIDAYLKVLERRDLVELSEENLKDHDEIYQQIEQRARQGIARSSDLAQIEGRRARASANLINARNNLIDAESEYLALVGDMPGFLEQPGSYNLVLPESLKEALQLARENHPGLQAAIFDARSSQSQYATAKSTFYPTLDFEIDHSWDENSVGNEGRTTDTTAMLRLRYNLFRGGGDRARMQESAYRAEESRAQRERVDRNLEERMRIAWTALEMIGEQRAFLELHESSSQETVSAYRKQFNIGKRTLLDLLDGENELFQASRSLLSATYQLAFARYRILAAAGVLLETLQVEPPANINAKK